MRRGTSALQHCCRPGQAWARPTLEAGAVVVQEHRGCARGHASVRVQREPACGAARRARARRAQVQELQAALERALRPGQLRRADGASALEVKTVDGFQVGGFQGSTRWVGSRVPGGLQLGGFQGYRWVPGFQARARTKIYLERSAMHACAGMSTFSTRGGLYERAQKRFGVSDGKRLFTYAFFEKQRLEALVRLSRGPPLCAGSVLTSMCAGLSV